MMYSWTITVALPDKLRTTLLNYLNFFCNYAQMVAGKHVLVEYAGTEEPSGTLHTLHTLTLRLKTRTESDREPLERLLQQYMQHIFSDEPPVLHEHRSQYETDLFLILCKRAVADVRTDIRFTIALLSDAEKFAVARTLAQLSTTNEDNEGRANDHSKVIGDAHTLSTQRLLQQMQELKLPSEKIELPPSLLHTLSPPNALKAGIPADASATKDHIQEKMLQGSSVLVLRDALVDAGEHIEHCLQACNVAENAEYAMSSSYLLRKLSMLADDAEHLVQEAHRAHKQAEPVGKLWRVNMLAERMESVLNSESALGCPTQAREMLLRICQELRRLLG